MNQQQKEVQQALLNNEKEVLEALKKNYEEALLEINSNLRYLMNREDADMQHVIYQAEYQKALKDQVEGILNQLNNNEFETVSEYLTHCYEEGFVGTMYDLQSQGIPLIFPIDQEKVVQAIQHDTKLSTNLYAAFDMKDLKKKISGEISRGISSAVTYNEIARNISGHANVNLNNAMRIARTEGHRINIKSAMDAQQKAREKGADIVKQWDASLDGKTRPHHRELDGQIRELDEDFVYSGGTVSAPAMFGDPSEDCNCRCALLQRARWALGEDITKYSPDAVEEISDDGATKLEKIKAKDYDEFKKKYMSEAEKLAYEKNATERVRSNAQKMNPLEKDGKSSKIKSVELPPEIYDIGGMSKDTAEAIGKAFDNIKEQYSVDISKMIVESLGSGYEKVPFQYIPNNVGGFLETKLVINKDYYFSGSLEEYTKRIIKNYESGALASKNIEDLIAHEMAHIMTFQDCDKYSVFERVEEEVREKFISGMSGYADRKHDGAETIAEAFVRYRRGEQLPADVLQLLNDYVLRYKK